MSVLLIYLDEPNAVYTSHLHQLLMSSLDHHVKPLTICICFLNFASSSAVH